MKSETQMLGGLFVRRMRWGLSRQGQALALLLLVLAAWWVAKGLYPFLAVTHRTAGELMVVDGWISREGAEQAAREYGAGHYQGVLVVAPVRRTGNTWESGRFKPEFIAETLARCGIPTQHVQVVFCDVVMKDRTYTSALAVREWLRCRGLTVQSIDVATVGTHARRSRILYQKAFRSRANVGVIALDELDYDPARWWRSSEGTREVLFEGLAYVYAKWFFVPTSLRTTRL